MKTIHILIVLYLLFFLNISQAALSTDQNEARRLFLENSFQSEIVKLVYGTNIPDDQLKLLQKYATYEVSSQTYQKLDALLDYSANVRSYSLRELGLSGRDTIKKQLNALGDIFNSPESFLNNLGDMPTDIKAGVKFFVEISNVVDNQDAVNVAYENAILLYAKKYNTSAYNKLLGTERSDINGDPCPPSSCTLKYKNNVFDYIGHALHVNEVANDAKSFVDAVDGISKNAKSFQKFLENIKGEQVVDVIFNGGTILYETYENGQKIIKVPSKYNNLDSFTNSASKKIISDINTGIESFKMTESLLFDQYMSAKTEEAKNRILTQIYKDMIRHFQSDLNYSKSSLNFLSVDRAEIAAIMINSWISDSKKYLLDRENSIKTDIRKLVSEGKLTEARKFASIHGIKNYAEDVISLNLLQKKYIKPTQPEPQVGSLDENNTTFLSSSLENTPTTKLTVYTYDATSDYNNSVKVNMIKSEINQQSQQASKIPMDVSVSMASSGGGGGFSTSYEMGKTVGSFVVKPGDRIGTVLNSSENAGTSRNLDISKVSSSITPLNLNRGGYNYTAWGEWNGDGKRYTDHRGQTFNIQHGYYTMGLATDRYPGGKMPTTGSATYNGALQGDYMDTSGNLERGVIGGTISLTANFARSTINGSLNVTKNGSDWAAANTGNMSINGASYYNNNFSVNGGGNAGLGGSFNGPNAEETSGAFYMSKSSGIPGNASGIYTAKQ